jgi:hypothetical protein
MTWILEHLQILIGVAAAIAYFLNRVRSQSSEDRSTSDGEGQEERTRRLQEEIRRKIAQRRGLDPDSADSRESVPPLMVPPPIPPIDPFGGPASKIMRRIEEAASQREPQVQPAAERARMIEAERRARLAEELEELGRVRAENERRVAALAAETERRTPARAPVVGVTSRGLRNALRRPDEVRRAVLMREILGPPVSLR